MFEKQYKFDSMFVLDSNKQNTYNNMGNTYFFAHDDFGVQFCEDVWSLLDLDGVLVKNCYVYVHDGHTYFGDTQDDVEGHICECKEVSATEWLKQEQSKLRKEVYTMGEGEEAHLCKIASLKREIDDLKEEKAPLFLYKAKVKELRDEIEEMKEQGGNYQYDLEELQADLQPLDEFMDDLTGVCQYEDLIDYIKGLQEKLDEGSEQHMKDTKKLNEFVEKNYVSKQILFAERQGAKDRYDIAIKQVNDLMKEVENQKGINQMLMDAIEAKSE